jgi:predicted O-linked N-acetylglucosamine transferase (SPINDLY family)
VFQLWLKILHQVPNSVLWLYGGKEGNVAPQNILLHAEKAGIGAERIIFGEKLEKGEHLARLKLADLFLDTLYYNGHTCTTDALYAGVPVLTLPGNTFASRVGASLVQTAGLPELVVSSKREYVTLAVQLAERTHPTLDLTTLRDRLVKDRAQHRLFDTPSYVRDLYMGYKQSIVSNLSGDTSTLPVIVKEDLNLLL